MIWKWNEPLNWNNSVSFFIFLWSVYTLLGAIKRYGLQPENRHFQCLDTTLTLARADTHAWIVHRRNTFYANALRLTFQVVYNLVEDNIEYAKIMTFTLLLKWPSYNKLYQTFVPNFKILGSVVPEKSSTKKSLHTNPTPTHTNTVTEKTKTIYPLYTSYTRGLNIEQR